MSQNDQVIVPSGRRRTRVKVCCIKDAAEAKLAIELGADALGKCLTDLQFSQSLTGDRSCFCDAERTRC